MFPRYGARRLSTAALPLSPSVLIAVGDMTHCYLNHSLFAKELEGMVDAGLGTKLRRMGEIHMQATFHLLRPFNISIDMAGVQALALATQRALADAQDAQELGEIHHKNWQALIAKAFGLKSKPKFLDPSVCRRVSLALSTAMQSNATLELAAKYGKAVSSEDQRAQAMDLYYDKVIIPCYEAAMASESLPKDSFPVTYGSLQVQSQRDALVAQHLQTGLWALGEKSPLLGMR